MTERKRWLLTGGESPLPWLILEEGRFFFPRATIILL